jgi:hypothetical protein
MDNNGNIFHSKINKPNHAMKAITINASEFEKILQQAICFTTIKPSKFVEKI